VWTIRYYWKAKATLCVSTAQIQGEFDCAKSAVGQGYIWIIGGSQVASLALVVCSADTAGDDNSGQFSIGPTQTQDVGVGSHISCNVVSWSYFLIRTAGKATAHHTYADPTLTVIQNTLKSGTCGE